MTTSGGSVWDRGPDGDGDDGRDAHRSDEEPLERVAGDPPEPSVPLAGTDAADDSGTVWSRGPSIDAALSSPAPIPRSAPQPVLPPAVRPAHAVPRRTARRRGAALVAVAAVAGVLALAWGLGVLGGDDGEPALADVAASPSMPIAPASDPSTTRPSAAPVTVSPSPTSTPTTTTAAITAPTTTTTTPSTSTPSTSTPSTSTTATSTTSSTSTTTTTTTASIPTSSASTAADLAAATGPQVTIAGHTGPCTFGNDCLIADFTIAGFDTPQREFVCEFADGSRYTFRFDGDGAGQACATSAADGAITVEVGGVRSETITR